MEKKRKPFKIQELIISEDASELAIDAISLVSDPAIEVDFVYFGKEKISTIDTKKEYLKGIKTNFSEIKLQSNKARDYILDLINFFLVELCRLIILFNLSL